MGFSTVRSTAPQHRSGRSVGVNVLSDDANIADVRLLGVAEALYVFPDAASGSIIALIPAISPT